MKTVSIVIPSHNYARYIREAIDSALAQTRPALEVIVVDDGSTDDTLDVLAAYGDRVRVLRQENQGVAVARNRGIAAARGEMVAFLDADDLWKPQKLELQMARFDADPSLGLVYCGLETFDPSGRTLEVKADGMEGRVASAMLLMQPNVLEGPGSTIVVPRRVAEEIGGFDARMFPGEDWDFCYRIAARYAIGCVREPLVRYRLHGSGGHLDIARMERAMLLAFEKAFASDDAAVRSLRNEAYGKLHRVLAGCYFDSRELGKFARHVVASLRYDPRNFGYFAAYPARVIRRRRAKAGA